MEESTSAASKKNISSSRTCQPRSGFGFELLREEDSDSSSEGDASVKAEHVQACMSPRAIAVTEATQSPKQRPQTRQSQQKNKGKLAGPNAKHVAVSKGTAAELTEEVPPLTKELEQIQTQKEDTEEDCSSKDAVLVARAKLRASLRVGSSRVQVRQQRCGGRCECCGCRMGRPDLV